MKCFTISLLYNFSFFFKPSYLFRRFETTTTELYEQWFNAIEDQIEYALGDDRVSLHTSLRIYNYNI